MSFIAGNYLTGKCLSRRTVLRSAGAVLGIPLLDAMLPAGPAEAKSWEKQTVQRLQYVYMPMGCDHSRWTPKGSTLGELPSILAPLAPVRDRINVLTNLELANAYPGSHATSNSAFLSCSTAKHTESTDYFLGTTADQIAAKHVGNETKLASMELSMDLTQMAGQCDNGYACAYQNNLSWSSPTTPLPSEAHPRIVFEAMFGHGGTATERAKSRKQQSRLLDSMADEIGQLKVRVGPADKRILDQYLESLRSVERRLEKSESDQNTGEGRDFERPLGVPASYEEHAKLMIDLQVLAMQADLTRVITFQLARETSKRSYPEVGVPESHHPLSHHGNNPNKIERLAKINRFHVSLFAYLLGRLAATEERSTPLLNNTVCMLGSGMGNPNVHDHTNLPTIVAGGNAAGFTGGKHIEYPKHTPLANIHLTLLQSLGLDLESFADSTGSSPELSLSHKQ
ncbi:MAG: DUF1552 domain-containing protein [Planctomycetaceae bacterium]|nr:DUF1552 domain-containing protein [Planctomycetaceae bacterium]